MTTTTPLAAAAARPAPPAPRVLDLELLALDLDRCTRCTGTLANIERAIEVVGGVLADTGTVVRLHTVIVGSEEQARRHRFVSSPTLRIAGRDIVFDTLESRCDACSELSGCAGGTSCRVWRYLGTEHDEAPTGLIVEALLREIAFFATAAERGAATGEAAAPPGEYRLPENLRDFFAGRAARAAADRCCPSSAAESCCEPAAKSSCCGDSPAARCACQ